MSLLFVFGTIFFIFYFFLPLEMFLISQAKSNDLGRRIDDAMAGSVFVPLASCINSLNKKKKEE